jgi:hypothetical protein
LTGGEKYVPVDLGRSLRKPDQYRPRRAIPVGGSSSPSGGPEQNGTPRTVTAARLSDEGQPVADDVAELQKLVFGASERTCRPEASPWKLFGADRLL